MSSASSILSPTRRPGTGSIFPVGTIRIQGGTKRIKVAMRARRKQDCWRDYARWVYEQHHGPIPAGKRVMHLDDSLPADQLDAIGNLALGDPVDAVFLWRDNHPKAAARADEKLVKIFTRSNYMRGMIHREMAILPTRWYAVDPARRIIVNQPRKCRWQVLAAAGLPATTDNWRTILASALGWPMLTLPQAAICTALFESGSLGIHALRNAATEVRARFGQRLEMLPGVLLSRMCEMGEGWIWIERRGRRRVYSLTHSARSQRIAAFPYRLVRGRELLANPETANARSDRKDQDPRLYTKIPDFANALKGAA